MGKKLDWQEAMRRDNEHIQKELKRLALKVGKQVTEIVSHHDGADRERACEVLKGMIAV